MSVLIIGNLNSKFVFEYVSEVLAKNLTNTRIAIATFNKKLSDIDPLKKSFCEDNRIEIICLGEEISKKPVLLLPFRAIRRFFKTRFCKKFDVIQMLFVHCIESVGCCFWAKKKSRIILSFFGSDLLRSSRRQLKMMRFSIKRANYITLGSNNMINAFQDRFSNTFNQKTKKIDFGSINAEHLKENVLKVDYPACKHRFNISETKISILCGYNGSRGQRHIEIIKSLSKLPASIKNKIELVFHLAYGCNDSYKNQIVEEARQSNISFVIVDEYLTGINLVEFRKSIDVMLNLQPTDALSNSMMESLFVGSIVIKGKWLDYPDLVEIGVFFLSIDSVDNLNEAIEKIVSNYSEYKGKTKNNNRCYDLMSWNTYKAKWIELLVDNNK